MPRLHVNLDHVRAIRAVRHGRPVGEVCREFRLNESAFAGLLERLGGVPDELLLDLERHLKSNQRLRRVVTRLLARVATVGPRGRTAFPAPAEIE